MLLLSAKAELVWKQSGQLYCEGFDYFRLAANRGQYLKPLLEVT